MQKRILVIDDDQDIVSFILTEDRYDVKTLSTGEQVFEMINQVSLDLELMDVMFADMDGRINFKKLKNSKERNHIPVILISVTNDLASTLNQHGAPNDFIP